MSKRTKDVTMVPKSVPIQRTDLSTFDDSFSFLKERFAAEMRRMDDEMNRFSVNLMSLYGQPGPNQPGQATGNQTTWDALANSPLIQGEGADKMLKLQFDVSTFEQTEVRVDVVDNKLIVTAHHEQKTPNSEASREFRREFVLPRGTNPNTIISSLSRDGVLTVQSPLPPLVVTEELKPTKSGKNILSKHAIGKPSMKRNRSSADSRTPNAAEETTPVTAPPALTSQVPQSPLAPKSPAATALPTGPAPTTLPTGNPPTTLPTGPTSPKSLLTGPTSRINMPNSPMRPTNPSTLPTGPMSTTTLPTNPTTLPTVLTNLAVPSPPHSPPALTPQKTSKTPSKLGK